MDLNVKKAQKVLKKVKKKNFEFTINMHKENEKA